MDKDKKNPLEYLEQYDENDLNSYWISGFNVNLIRDLQYNDCKSPLSFLNALYRNYHYFFEVVNNSPATAYNELVEYFSKYKNDDFDFMMRYLLDLIGYDKTTCNLKKIWGIPSSLPQRFILPYLCVRFLHK